MNKDFHKIGSDIGALVAEKNAAYGDSFAKCGEFLRLLFPVGIAPGQYEDALALVRIFDKQMRIATRKDAFGESPYRDIAGYGILGVAKDENTPSPGDITDAERERIVRCLDRNMSVEVVQNKGGNNGR